MRQVRNGDWVGRVSPNWMRRETQVGTALQRKKIRRKPVLYGQCRILSIRNLPAHQPQVPVTVTHDLPRLRGLKWGEPALLPGSLTRCHLKARLARPLRQLTLVASHSWWLMAGACAGLRLPTERGTGNQVTW